MLYLRTFGGLTLSSDGIPVSGAASQRSRLALLALLAGSGPAGLSRDKVMGYLWAESDSERARGALKQAVYALRKDLKSEELIPGSGTLSLNPAEIKSDIGDFQEALRAGDLAGAVALYAGPFLDGVYLREAPEFERWSADLRDRLAHEWATAVETLAARLAAAGDHRGAVGWWRQLAAREPLSGRVARALMAALADSGDIPGALQTFRVHEALLLSEVDSAPSAEVRELAEQLREGRWTTPPAVQLPLAAALRPSPPETQTPQPVASIAPAIGASGAPPVIDAPPTARRAFGARRIAIVSLVVPVLLGGLAVNAVPADIRAYFRTLITRGPATLSPRVVVVAPLENRTGDPTLDQLGDLASELIARQLQDANFDVVPPQTSWMTAHAVVDRIPKLFRPHHDRAFALAEETGAGKVVVGNYSRNPQGDSLYFVFSVADVSTERFGRQVGPVSAPAKVTTAVLAALAGRVLVALAAAVDSSAGANTVASLAEPPSLDAYELVVRAWETFFIRTSDTAAVFAYLARASTIDSMYPAPWLIRAYVLDVNEKWPEVRQIVDRVNTTMQKRLSRTERLALDLYDADMRGDLFRRRNISYSLMGLSPGSSEMALLVVLSECYLNHPGKALDVLDRSDPNRGMNLITPLYWAWRAEAEHQLGDYAAERRSAEKGIRRFPEAPRAVFTLVRSLAARGEVDEVRSRLARGVPGAIDPRGESADLALFAARELRTHGRPADAKQTAAELALSLAAAGATDSRKDTSRLADALYEAGDYTKAKEVYRRLLQSDPTDIGAEGRLGTIAARAGDTTTALQTADRLARLSRPYLLGRHTIWRARIAALMGRPQAAGALLQQAIAEGYQIVNLVDLTPHQDADFATLRNDPTFIELVGPRKEAPGRSRSPSP